MYTIELIKDLSEKLERGLITPNQCLSTLSTLMFERLDLKEKCESMLRVEREKHSSKRMEMYKANPEWFELHLKLISAWRDCRVSNTKNLKEQISYLADKDLAYIDPVKLEALDITNKDIVGIYKSLEELILIPKK